MFNKKEFIQQKLEEGCLILRNIILCAANTRYQLMLEVDIS